MFQKHIHKGFKTILRKMSDLSSYNFETLKVISPAEFVYHVELNNPNKRNALNSKSWNEIRQCFQMLNKDENCRSVVFSGAGKCFTAGIDLSEMSQIMGDVKSDDPARRAFQIRRMIMDYQSSFTSLELCLKPVIAAVHDACIGAGVDVISCSDIRLASADAWFQIKEVQIGLAADVGTLQRFPKIIGNDSLARELVYTGRKFTADEAMKMGFISGIFDNKDILLEHAVKLAKEIADLSPVAVQSSKAAIIYSRDHSADEGLRMQADWNQVMLQSEDLIKSVMAAFQKQKPIFAKL